MVSSRYKTTFLLKSYIFTLIIIMLCLFLVFELQYTVLTLSLKEQQYFSDYFDT